jgi:hypothetical protein
MMKNTSKAIVGLILIAVLTASTTLVVAIEYYNSQRLRPVGRVRVSLEGTARWNGFVQVHDGSFSAELFTDASNTAKVHVSPLSIPLAGLRASDITFWAYHYSTTNVYPMIDFILDNGRRMEGSAFDAKASSEPVSGTAPVYCEDGTGATPGQTCLGFPTADIWIRMKAKDAFYSSYAGIDPSIPATFGINTPKTIALWAIQFPGAKIVQMEIAYRAPSSPSIVNIEVYIDDINIRGRLIPVEPESTSDVPSGIP